MFDEHLLFDGGVLVVARAHRFSKFLVLLPFLSQLLLKTIEESSQSFESGDTFAIFLRNDLVQVRFGNRVDQQLNIMWRVTGGHRDLEDLGATREIYLDLIA